MSMLSDLTVEKIQKAYQKNNYKIYEENYNINIFGIRKDENISNKFNDVIGILYKESGIWKLKKYQATTDPGLYYREHPCNINGTAILKEGYYRSGFKLGMHQGKYQALVQNTPLDLYRDRNKDGVLDRKGKIYTEIAGINIHRATGIEGNISENVDKWSAGCQVIAGYNDFKEFMRIVNKSAELYGIKFSYALFNEKEVF